MDAEYITTLRTGVVAAHSALLFGKKNFSTIGLPRLGNIMTVCLEILLAKLKDKMITARIYRHHGQEERFAKAEDVQFVCCDTYEEVFSDTTVIISAVTQTTQNFVRDNCFKEGIVVAPICIKVFQNCDLFFDNVSTD